MKVFTVLSSVAAVVVALSSTADAQRLLRSEASAQTDSTVTTTDFTTLGSMGGSSFTPGNVAAGSSFGALDKEGGSMNDHRPSGSMRGGFGSGNGMHNVGSGDGFAHGSGSFGGGRGGFGGHGHHGMGGGSFSGSSFAGSFSGHGGFGGSGFGSGHVGGGSFGGNPPSIGSGEAPTEGSGEGHAPAAAATSSVAASGSA
ncbi:hypothetical protein PHYSODRAFT_319051 [Phytophthora sojae]|nr:hypothetical protein PHYSODRAFT_319051 [Phytophthora sojae]EGZ08118.1 hypothetical protein PHYSODRAFT_319051 [Phytophthora sojae]|eukprot:XP_009536290.1 hypothetical protein PHYSODRAFT_319051 [Phytophthora sojae]